MKKPTRARPLFAYVGSYTTPERHGDGDGINVYRVDRRTGAFTHLQRLGGLENPSFLAVNADGTRLYSVHGDRSEINSFTIDPRTGQLAPLNRQPTGGYNPVHLAFDATGRFLAVCNYGTDSLAVFPLADDGSLLPYRTLTTVTGTLGPHRIQQRTMCVHHIPLDAQGRFFYVPCKGSDAVIAYRLDTRRKILVEAARVTARPGAAPRHIDFHPAKALAYVINELEFDDHHLPPGSAKRRAHAAADDPGHAVGVHRLQHGRRDLGRSRRPQCLRLQSRPRQHRRVRHRPQQGHAVAAPVGADPWPHAALLRLRSRPALPLRRQPGQPLDRGLPRRPRWPARTDPHPGKGRQPGMHRLLAGLTAGKRAQGDGVSSPLLSQDRRAHDAVRPVRALLQIDQQIGDR